MNLRTFLVTWHCDEYTDACVVEATDEADALRMAVSAKLEDHRKRVADAESETGLPSSLLAVPQDDSHITNGGNWGVSPLGLLGARGVRAATFGRDKPPVPGRGDSWVSPPMSIKDMECAAIRQASSEFSAMAERSSDVGFASMCKTVATNLDAVVTRAGWVPFGDRDHPKLPRHVRGVS